MIMNALERLLRVMLITIALLVSCAISCDAVRLAESPDTVITHVEAVIRARFEHIAKYVVIEHYAVYRNGAAETDGPGHISKEHGHQLYHRLKGWFIDVAKSGN